MRPIAVTLGAITAASANNICLSQTPSAGNLTIAGSLATAGVATLDVPRRVLVTTAADESAKTFTIYGTNRYGIVITDTVVVPAASTNYTALDFKTVTRVTISSNAAGAVTVGTNGIASSQTIPLDYQGRPECSLQVTVTGTVSYTVQQTLDNPQTTGSPTWVNHPDTNLVAATATAQGNYAYIPAATRVTLNSGTGSVVFTVIQAGLQE